MSHFSPPRMLAEFHEKLGEPFGHATLDDPELVELRVKLHREETERIVAELEAGNLVGLAQELAIGVYAFYGTAHVLGIPLNRVLGVVHKAHMAGPNAEPPDIEGILRSFMPGYGRSKTCEVCGAVFHKTSARDWLAFEQRRFCGRECARLGQDRPGTPRRPRCYKDLHSMDEDTPEGKANIAYDKRGRRSCRACRSEGSRQRRARLKAAGIKRTDHLKRKTSPAKPAPKPEVKRVEKPEVKPEVKPAPPKPEPEIPPAPRPVGPPKPVWRPAGFSAQPRVNVRSGS